MTDEPPTRQMPASPTPNTRADSAGGAGRFTSLLDLQRVMLTLIALVLIVGIVAWAFHDDSQGAAAVLGVVIPALTAAIGLTAGVQAGERSGDAKAATATQRERERIQGMIQPLADNLSARTDQVWETLEAASTTAPGETERVISVQPDEGEATEVRWDGEVMNAIQADVGRLQGLAEGLAPDEPAI